jgi:hypothetical protein
MILDMQRRKFLKVTGLSAGAALAMSLGGKTFALGTDAPDRKVLPDFPLYKQETPYTCGPASVRMCLAFLGHNLPEKEIAKRMGTSPLFGTGPWQLTPVYNRYLRELKTGLTAKDKLGRAATNQVIFDSIKNKRPVIFSWLVENDFRPGTAVGHYCVVIGFDQARREFTIANPFGYIHALDFDRFRRLAKWSPKPGDLPDLKKTPHSYHLPPDLVVLT